MPTAAGLVTVATYASEEQAAEALEVLEDAGIKAVVLDLGLEVARADAPRALEILRSREAAVREAAPDEALAEDEADVACLSCGAKIPEYLERCPACGFSYS